MTLCFVELRYDCRSHRGEQASIGGGSTYQVKYMTRYQDDDKESYRYEVGLLLETVKSIR